MMIYTHVETSEAPASDENQCSDLKDILHSFC
jgi:hypothetical protein